MNILIVDDKPNLARVTAVALRTLGCESCSADSTAAANHKLETEKIDAIFLDLNLNGEDGFLFLSELVGRPNPVPVILFTAHSREDIEAKGLRRGAFGCLFKPFTLDDLRHLLGKIAQCRKPLANNGV